MDKQREKLIELMKNAPLLNVLYGDEQEWEIAADYLLANGVIAPPCKVGYVVYSYLHIWRKEDGISPYQITNITITQNKKGVWTKKYRAMQVIEGKTTDWQLNFNFDDIGKTVFLSHEDAEKALEERKEK